MLYFARHLEVVAGVAPEAAPLESFGVPGELLCSTLSHSSCLQLHAGPGASCSPLTTVSSPRRLSAACPPTGRGSGPAQGTPSRGEGSHPTWATSGGPGYAAPRDCSGTSRRRHRAHLQAWIHIQHPRKLPALSRPVGGY